MKFKVTIGWRCEFIFDYAFDATEFMLAAAKHRNPEDDRENIKLEVIFPEEEVSEEGSDD